MLLYRGDKYYNVATEPGRFWFDGIRAKSFGKGDPAYIKKAGLLKAIRQHIHHPGKADVSYYDATDFISFSTDQARAMYWVSDKGQLLLTTCSEPYRETRYVFRMDIPDNDLISRGDGIYMYSFVCNQALRKSNVAAWQGIEIPYYTNCPLCQGGLGHQILLVDTVKYLSINRKDESESDALKLATEDSEWLVLPNDPLDHGSRSSSVQRADFWSVETYTVVGEKRDPMYASPMV